MEPIVRRKKSLPKHPSFSERNFKKLCDQLASADKELKNILNNFGYPPMWTRPNSFETLVHIILEQQVSLASALAALNKLRDKLGMITPEAFLKLSDEELRACYFSRQKMSYVRHLATAIADKEISLESLEVLPSDEIRKQLSKFNGIGNWTVDIYLIFALRRADVFPIGDLAAINALKQVKKLPASATRDEILAMTVNWAPHRTIATMILWHHYLSGRKKYKLP